MIDTSTPVPVDIDLSAAIALLAELRVNECPEEFNAFDAFLLQHGAWIPGSLILREAKALAQQRGAMLRPWKGQFKSDLAHSLPSTQYLN
jgi:hypothetical protein